MSLIIPSGLYTGDNINNRPVFSENAYVKFLSYTNDSSFIYGAFSTVDGYNRLNFAELDASFNVKSGTKSPILFSLVSNTNAEFESNGDIITMDSSSLIRCNKLGNKLTNYTFPTFPSMVSDIPNGKGGTTIRKKTTGINNYTYVAGPFIISNGSFTKSKMAALNLIGNNYTLLVGFTLFNIGIVDIDGIKDYTVEGTDRLLIYGEYGNTSHRGLSLIDASTGARDDSFVPPITTGKVSDIAMVESGSTGFATIVVAGNFTATVGKTNLIALDGTGGYSAYVSFDQYILNKAIYRINVRFSGVDPAIILAAVANSGLDAPHTLYRLQSTGAVYGPFTPVVTDGIIETIIYNNDYSRILISGTFSTVNGQPRDKFVVIDSQNGSVY